MISLAGRTASPLPQPLPVRIGGFGGEDGLARHLERERVDLLIDATHPFAVRMRANAVGAARRAGVPLIRLERPGFQREPGDDWRIAGDLMEAAWMAADYARPFLAIGRNEIGAFAALPRAVARSVDPIPDALRRPGWTYLEATGPFATEAESKLFLDHGVDCVVAKDSGGAASSGKLAAARALSLPVIMVRRPIATPGLATVADVDAAMAEIERRRHAGSSRPTERAVNT